VGLVGCVLTVLVFATSLLWVVVYQWWDDGDLHVVYANPGQLGYATFYRHRDLLRTVQQWAPEGLKISPASKWEWTSKDMLQRPVLTMQNIGASPEPDVDVMVPLWSVFAVLALPTVFLWYRDRRPPRGHCQRCGYNLKGNLSGVCPECGDPT
jgi:hypothetical protein